MDHRPLMFRLAAVTAICLPAVWAAGPGASALAAPGRTATGAPRQAAAPARIRAAATSAAPLVPDSGPAGPAKTGLAAPATSRVMLWANAKKQSMARSFLAKKGWRAGPEVSCVKRPCRAAVPASRDLRLTQRRQATNYFCGPAAVTEMLAQLHVTVHQRLAARELGTTPNGTDWSDSGGYPVPEVLNKTSALTIMSRSACPGSRLARSCGPMRVTWSPISITAGVRRSPEMPMKFPAARIWSGIRPVRQSFTGSISGDTRITGPRRIMRIPCTGPRASAGPPRSRRTHP